MVEDIPPLGNVTADEVKSWFPISKFGPPLEDKVRDFTKTIEWSRQLMPALCEDSSWRRRSKRFSGVVKSAKALKKQFEQLIKEDEQPTEMDQFVDADLHQKIGAAIDGLRPFLETNRLARKPGARGPKGDWIDSAAEWAPMIAACLTKPGKKPPSFKTDTGPVAAVLAKAVFRVYGLTKSVEEIGSRLRDLKAADFGRGARDRAEKL